MVPVLLLMVTWFIGWRWFRRLRHLRDDLRQWQMEREGTLPVMSPGIGVLADIERLANEMVRDMTRRLEHVTRQKNQIDAILSGMAEGVVALDSAERVIVLNQAARTMLGVGDRRVEGMSLVDVVSSIDLIRCFEKLLRDKEDIENEILHHSDHEYHIRVHGSPLENKREIMGAVVILNDLTHLRRLEQVRSDFVSNVSHEIKTPLTSIKGFIEVLLESLPEANEESRSYLDIIKKQADRLDEIVNDLLLLSRVESDDTANHMVLKDFCLADVVLSAVGVCQAKWQGRKSFTLLTTCPPDLRVLLNAGLLEQALTNLIDNAIKYGGQNPTVEINALSGVDEVSLSVGDNGPGIAQEHLGRLFERFYRADPARRREDGGSGLGLAIVRHIVQAHGGTIQVESELGQGTTFTIFFKGKGKA